MDKKKALIFAVLLAVVGVILIQLMVSGEKKKYADESQLDLVAVAKNMIAAGTTIDAGMLMRKKYHKSFIPKEAILWANVNQVIGTAPKADIPAGAPLLTTYFKEGLISGSITGFLSSKIMPGERAFTIRVDNETGVAGLIRPGDFVDIMGTFDNGSIPPRKVTMTILQAVPVLAIGSLVGTGGVKNQARQATSYTTITLSVTPEEAELIEFARRKTRLVFTLRNVDDQEVVENLKQIDFNAIFAKKGLSDLQQKRNARNKQRIEILK